MYRLYVWDYLNDIERTIELSNQEDANKVKELCEHLTGEEVNLQILGSLSE